MTPTIIKNKSVLNGGRPVAFKASWDEIITVADLPPSTKRLEQRDFAIIVEAVQCGLLSIEDVLKRYKLRPATLEVITVDYLAKKTQGYQPAGASEPAGKQAVVRPLRDTPKTPAKERSSESKFSNRVPDLLERDGFVLNGSRRTISRGDKSVHLPPSQLLIVAYLMNTVPGERVQAYDLLNAIWREKKPAMNSLYAYLSTIRAALRDVFGTSPVHLPKITETYWQVDEYKQEGAA